MSSKLKNNQLLAAELLASGMKAKNVAEKLNIRCETISRWKQCDEFKDFLKKSSRNFLTEIIEEQIYIHNLAQNALRNVLEDKEIDPVKKAMIAIKLINSIKYFHIANSKFDDRAFGLDYF